MKNNIIISRLVRIVTVCLPLTLGTLAFAQQASWVPMNDATRGLIQEALDKTAFSNCSSATFNSIGTRYIIPNSDMLSESALNVFTEEGYANENGQPLFMFHGAEHLMVNGERTLVNETVYIHTAESGVVSKLTVENRIGEQGIVDKYFNSPTLGLIISEVPVMLPGIDCRASVN